METPAPNTFLYSLSLQDMKLLILYFHNSIAFVDPYLNSRVMLLDLFITIYILIIQTHITFLSKHFLLIQKIRINVVLVEYPGHDC